MATPRMDRKRFLATLGAGACMCGAATAMSAALADAAPKPAGEAKAPVAAPVPESKPGDQTPARAAKRMEFVDGWVPRLFKVMDEQLDEPTRRALMSANGKACYSAYAPDQKPRPEPATPERIREWVNGHAQAGYAMDGDAIRVEYVGSAETKEASPECICLCPTVEGQTAATVSPTFCWCSVGYVKEMHERVFGRPVDVELLGSVLTGEKRCRFRMTLA